MHSANLHLHINGLLNQTLNPNEMFAVLRRASHGPTFGGSAVGQAESDF